jgi:hypothetical protein
MHISAKVLSDRDKPAFTPKLEDSSLLFAPSLADDSSVSKCPKDYPPCYESVNGLIYLPVIRMLHPLGYRAYNPYMNRRFEGTYHLRLQPNHLLQAGFLFC